MTNEMIRGQSKQIRGRVSDLMGNAHVDDPEKVDARRKRLLALLESRYGYTNKKAVEELERLLKQFYRTKRSFGNYRIRPKSHYTESE